VMFEVRVHFPFDDDFAVNDGRLEAVAGPSDWGGAGVNGLRDHGYVRETFEEAADLALRVRRAFPEWGIRMQEQIS
jgi:hypothetical protein